MRLWYLGDSRMPGLRNVYMIARLRRQETHGWRYSRPNTPKPSWMVAGILGEDAAVAHREPLEWLCPLLTVRMYKVSRVYQDFTPISVGRGEHATYHGRKIGLRQIPVAAKWSRNSLACGLWERGHRYDIMDKPHIASVRMLPGRQTEQSACRAASLLSPTCSWESKTGTTVHGSPAPLFTRTNQSIGHGHRAPPRNLSVSPWEPTAHAPRLRFPVPLRFRYP